MAIINQPMEPGQAWLSLCWKKYHQFQLHHITEQLGKARGKANVLANLAHVATGEYFSITDADIQVNPNWIQSMLVRFDDETAIVSGITIGKGNNFFEKLQALDWTYFNAVLTATTNMGIPCTAVGNNMVISRKAYFATGGYESSDFSVTEDYKLYAAVRKLKWKTKNIATPELFISPKHSLIQVRIARTQTLVNGRQRAAFILVAYVVCVRFILPLPFYFYFSHNRLWQ